MGILYNIYSLGSKVVRRFYYLHNIYCELLNKNKNIMPMTVDRFFDWQTVSMPKLLTELKMNPNETEQILTFVMDKVKHFAEFEAKKECLKHRYEHKLQKLYAEYMQEE